MTAVRPVSRFPHAAARLSYRPPRIGRVLAVDDEPMILTALRRTLRRDHEVVVCNDAVAALDILVSGERFDVILCDLAMPRLSGSELHAKITRIAPDQAERMIFLTGGAFSPTTRAFLERVQNRCIGKPFDPSTLRALVSAQVQVSPP